MGPCCFNCHNYGDLANICPNKSSTIHFDNRDMSERETEEETDGDKDPKMDDYKLIRCEGNVEGENHSSNRHRSKQVTSAQKSDSGRCLHRTEEKNKWL